MRKPIRSFWRRSDFFGNSHAKTQRRRGAEGRREKREKGLGTEGTRGLREKRENVFRMTILLRGNTPIVRITIP
jgi:hypothetical protein